MSSAWPFELIKEEVIRIVAMIAQEQNIHYDSIYLHSALVDELGFSSLEVATLTVHLENSFKVDPFAQKMAAITDMRTIQDFCLLYDSCLNKKPCALSNPTQKLKATQMGNLNSSQPPSGDTESTP